MWGHKGTPEGHLPCSEFLLVSKRSRPDVLPRASQGTLFMKREMKLRVQRLPQSRVGGGGESGRIRTDFCLKLPCLLHAGLPRRWLARQRW